MSNVEEIIKLSIKVLMLFQIKLKKGKKLSMLWIKSFLKQSLAKAKMQLELKNKLREHILNRLKVL
jgi:hypothetical protein